MFETVVENDMLILEGSKEASDCNWTRTQNQMWFVNEHSTIWPNFRFRAWQL